MNSCRHWILSPLLSFCTQLAVAGQPSSSQPIQQWRTDCKQNLEQGQYQQALPACQRVVDALEEQLPDHPDFAAALNALGRAHLHQRAYQYAEPLFLRSLRIFEQALGPENLKNAAVLNNLALLQWQQSRYKKAEQLYLRSISIREKVLGRDHPDVATVLNTLGMVYENQDALKDAERVWLRALRIREKALRADHPDLAESLGNLAFIYQMQGRWREAEPFHFRSLAILEKAHGPNHPEVATVLNNLAAFFEEQGDYKRAESFYLRSLQITEKVLPPEDPSLATTISNLALLYNTLGSYKTAESLMLRALAMHEKKLGQDGYQVARSLNNLAAIYMAQGAYRQAEPLLLRCHQIWEKADGPNRLSVATSLNNIAKAYREQGKYEQAEPLLLRSLQIRERLLGPDHPEVAPILSNLGVVYQRQKKYVQAELIFRRALRIREKNFAADHVDVARSMASLAGLYLEQGDHSLSEVLYLRSLQIRERALGADHPDIAACLSSLAFLAAARKDWHLATQLLGRVLDIHEHGLQQAATEARILALLDLMREAENHIYSLALEPGASAEMIRLAMRTSLLRKGRAAETGYLTGWAIKQSLTNAAQLQRFEQWQSLRAQYETIFLRGPGKISADVHKQFLTDLRNRIDAAEHDLAQVAPQLHAWTPPKPERIIGTIAGVLPPNSAFIDILQFEPTAFEAIGKENQRGKPRYAVLLLFPNSRIERVDLGDGESIDQVAGEFLIAVRKRHDDPRTAAMALYARAFAPLLPVMGSAKQLLVSPDGSLNLVPFAAIHDGTNYLVDSPYEFRYLTSGRELLRQPYRGRQNPSMVLADPDLWAHAGPKAEAPTAVREVREPPGSLYGTLASGLPPLPGARAEGQLVATLLHVAPILDGAASEAAVRAVRSPSVLHIATHALFLDEVSDGAIDSISSRSALLPSTPIPALASRTYMDRVTGKAPGHALSRAALVLAGAARAEQAANAMEDGLLTAEEARSLNLYGTQLVVLSACDTGRGMVKAGQGVYGLRRAFYLAGAETVVMSLWPVSDTGTQSLMQVYYRLLMAPERPRSRISALTEAMRAEKSIHPHPYYWAPFIASGLDLPLRRP